MSDRDIREAVEYLAGTNKEDKIFIFDAEIDSYDESSRTCVCTLVGGKSGNTIPDVRLMCDVDDGFLILPTVGTVVTIILSSFTEPVIIGYSGIDRIVMRGGDLGGLAIVPKLVEKINNLEKLVNDLIIKYNVHVHPETGTTTGPTVSQETEVLTLTIRSDIENENITQG